MKKPKNLNGIFSRDDQDNINNLQLLMASLKDTLSTHPPEFICKTYEIPNFSTFNKNDYTLCWAEENVPDIFISKMYLKTYNPLCFSYNTKPTKDSFGMYNVGYSMMFWCKNDNHTHKDADTEHKYCFISFKILPEDIINQYNENDPMLIIYRDFECKFEQLISPFYKTSQNVWRKEFPYPSLDELPELFKQFD